MQHFKVDTAFGRCWIGYGSLSRMPQAIAQPIIQQIWLPGKPGCRVPAAPTQRANRPPANVLEAAESLRQYFSDGKMPVVPWPYLDMAQLTTNQQKLLRVVAGIPSGSVCSYGEVARLAGFPKGARFAGNTLARNPFPVFIPCHRVIRADGRIGGFGAGTEMKRKMLALENDSGR